MTPNLVRTLARDLSSSVRGRKIIDLAADLAALDLLPSIFLRWLFALIVRYMKTETFKVMLHCSIDSIMLHDYIEQLFNESKRVCFL